MTPSEQREQCLPLVGYSIVANVFYGSDRREYTRRDLTLMAIYNPVDYMVPIGKARITKERNGSPHKQDQPR